MPKNIILAVRDSIVPIIMRDLIASFVAENPKSLKAWEKWLVEINTALRDQELQVAEKMRSTYRFLYKAVSNKVIDYMQKEQFSVGKGFLVMTLIAEDTGQELPLGEIFDEILERVTNALCRDDFDKDLDALLESAKKQKPKVLAIIQKMGYFR